MAYKTILYAVAYISLTACAAQEPIVVHQPVEVPVTVYETVPVPAAFLTPCRVELGELETNGDMERALARALVELRRCTLDKKSISELE